MKPIASTKLDAVGYDPESSTLFVRFITGGVHAFDRVPPFIHTEFLTAKSKQQFFDFIVRTNYQGRRLPKGVNP